MLPRQTKLGHPLFCFCWTNMFRGLSALFVANIYWVKDLVCRGNNSVHTRWCWDVSRVSMTVEICYLFDCFAVLDQMCKDAGYLAEKSTLLAHSPQPVRPFYQRRITLMFYMYVVVNKSGKCRWENTRLVNNFWEISNVESLINIVKIVSFLSFGYFYLSGCFAESSRAEDQIEERDTLFFTKSSSTLSNFTPEKTLLLEVEMLKFK